MNSVTRPGPITAICVIWTAVTVFELYHFATLPAAGTAELPAWSMFYIIGMAAATLTGIAGMWQMKKWGLMLFTGTAILNQAFALMQGEWQLNSLLLPALVIIVGMAHMRQLR